MKNSPPLFSFFISFSQLKYIVGLIQEFGDFCAHILVLLIPIFYTKEDTKHFIWPSLFVFTFLIQFSFPFSRPCTYFKNPANNVHIYVVIKSPRQNLK